MAVWVLCATAAVAAAQRPVQVTGTVTDGTGAPLPGATVMLRGSTTVGTSTDLDGAYALTVPSDGVLVASMVGYAEQSAEVRGRSRVDFRLAEDAEFIDNAVVVGYGSAKKVGNLVGSVQTVSGETLRNAPSASALDRLQGQVAGLAVLTSGGVAGDNNVSMTLHGVGSLGSSTTPLFVVDGIPSSARTIMSMNPNDILSVSVLKDASATSIYGARAANGVVYVTTKSGAYATKATVTVRSYWGISTLADRTMYDNMMTGAELKDFWIRSGIYTPQYIQETYTDQGYTYDTRWYEYFQQFNNPQSQNDITIEGGGQRVAYMVAGSQFYQQGNTIGNEYARYTVRSNVQGHPTDWLKFGVNVNLSYDRNRQNANWGNGSNAGGNNYLSGGLSMILNPLYPATGEDGNVLDKFPNGLYNQRYVISKVHDLTSRVGILGSAYVEIEPYKDLKLISRVGTDAYASLRNYQRLASYEAYAGNGMRYKAAAFSYSNTITNTLEYAFGIGDDHGFNVLLGQEGIDNHYEDFYAQASGQTTDTRVILQKGEQDTRDMEEDLSESRFLSFFGHLDYTFREKYILDATLRYDASSRFGRDNRWAPFWAAGALWKVKREDFLRDVRWIDDLNFKVSYGTQGNAAIGNYRSLGLISAGDPYANGTSSVIGQPANDRLTWEKQGLLTVALTGRLWDAVDFDLEWYDRRTTDMLMSVPQPYTTGFSSLMANVGGLSNTGLDVTLGVDILRGRDYFLRFSTTFNYNWERVTELFNGLDRWEVANTGLTYVVGQPVRFYYPIFAGIDPETGQPTWYKAGDDPDVTTRGETTDKFDETALTQDTGCRYNAPVNGGFGLSGTWRHFSFLVDFSYVLGKYLINNDAFFYANPAYFAGYNTSKAVSDFWTPENPNAAWPDWSSGAVMEFDTHLLEEASFLRLKSLQVAYSLPERVMGWQKVLKDCKLTFTGRNLLTFTRYKGADPEVDSNLVLGLPGNSKQYLLGLELTF